MLVKGIGFQALEHGYPRKKGKELNSRLVIIFNRVCGGQSPETKSEHSILFSQSRKVIDN